MSTAKQYIWLVLALIIIVFSVWYYNRSTPIIQLDQKTLANTIDTTISQVTVRQFNTQGTLAHLLTSPLMQHIQKNNVYLIESPHIVINQEEQPPWEISSKSAKTFEGVKKITFKGDVVVHQDKSSKSQPSTFKTEEVTYFPKEKKASSDVLVTYEQPGNIIQSLGMNAYLEEKRVELLHQARGSYVPENG